MDNYFTPHHVFEGNHGGAGERSDLQYDNEALDVLTELFDNENFAENILQAQGRINSPQINRSDKPVPQVILPDSPPYSGSEPYSPEVNRLISPSCSDISTQSSFGSSPGYYPADMLTHQQQLHNHMIQQQQQQLHLQQLQERQLQHLQQQQQNVIAAAAAVAAVQNGMPILGHPGLRLQNPVPIQQIIHDDQPPVYCIDSNSPYPAKKRKYPNEIPENMISSQAVTMHQNGGSHQSLNQQQVKQEPAAPCDYDTDMGYDLSPGLLSGGSYQPIKWKDFEKAAWCPVLNSHGQKVNVQAYRLDGDKGFNYSQVDKAFVCQKKNHFQITACVTLSEAPQYVMTPEGPKPIEGLFMHFYGVKEETVNQVIQIDQSQADRTKKKFCPVPLQANGENSWKVTIGRLHFSDTTLNNMRKRGKPNPDQRYFLLVVGVFAHCQGKDWPLVQQCSEKVIVRASNPGQFQDSESEPVKWQPGQSPNSIHHIGKVGINTDTPDEALTVNGNVKVMGAITQPSDQRVKEDITQVDTKEQLKNLQAIKLYRYKYKEEFADAVGLDDAHALETGVIAQELEVIIPEAVKTTSDVKLSNGEVIENLKVVDKNRLFMESLGAVKELSNITTNLESKISYLERFNKKLQKIKRIGSIRSTASTDTTASHVTTISTISHVTIEKKLKDPSASDKYFMDQNSEKKKNGVCSSRFLQILIFVLVFVMVACIGVILAMLLMEQYKGTDSSRLNATLTTTPSDISFSSKLKQKPTTVSPVNECNMLYQKGCSITTPYNFCPIYACQFDGCRHLIQPDLSAGLGTGINVSDQSLDIDMDKDVPQETGRPFSYAPTVTQESSSRKVRSTDDSTGVLGDMKIFLKSLNSNVSFYDLAAVNCLDCNTVKSSYTYVVQIHKTFRGTPVNLTIERTGKSSWRNLVLCPYVLDASPDLLKPCTKDPQSGFPASSAITTPFQKSVGFNITVGTYLKQKYTLRLTNKEAEDPVAFCEEGPSKDMLEVNIWFAKVCDGCVATSIMSQEIFSAQE